MKTLKKPVVFIGCAIAVLAAVGAGVVFAVRTGDRPAMDRSQALEHALADAGLGSSDVTIVKQKLEKEGGESYYDIVFNSGGYEYQYQINASTGAVEGVSIEALSAGGQASAGAGADPAPGRQPDAWSSQEEEGQGNGESGREEEGQRDGESGQEEEGQGNGESGQEEEGQGNGESGREEEGQRDGESGWNREDRGEVDLEAAKAAALADAGVNAEEAFFFKAEIDWDGGIKLYDIEFYTASAEYEYEIDAATGGVLDRDVDMFQDTAGAEEAAVEGSYIGIDKAKSIAAAHAGFDVEEVVFVDTELEREQSHAEYEIEFYKDCLEYDYEINAFTGDILDYDSEYID